MGRFLANVIFLATLACFCLTFYAQWNLDEFNQLRRRCNVPTMSRQPEDYAHPEVVAQFP